MLSSGAALYDDTYQDFDLVRRPCVGGGNGQGGSLPAPTNSGTVQPNFPATPAEQVCGPNGTLGLVLPIRAPVNDPGVLPTSDLYPTKPCLRGSFNFGPAPKVPGSATKDTLCPNGDVPLGNKAADYNPSTGQVVASSGICLIPSAADGDSQCINGKNNLPVVVDPPNPTLVATDGRVYNLHVYGPGSTPLYKTDAEVGKSPVSTFARQITGSFFRIHSTRTLIASGPTCPGAGGDGRCCARSDSTDQINCLVEADPCSLGFSSLPAPELDLQTSGSVESALAASINGVRSAAACWTSLTSTYSLSRLQYFNTVIGFENVTGNELGMARCFAGAIVGGPAAYQAFLQSYGLVPLPTGPVCREYVPGSNACADNASVSLPQ